MTVGQVKLYSTEWKLITYIDLEIADRKFETVKNYAQMSADFCKITSTYFGLITQVV